MKNPAKVESGHARGSRCSRHDTRFEIKSFARRARRRVARDVIRAELQF